MMRHPLFPALALLLASGSARAADRPQWRGPDRANVSRANGPPLAWPQGGSGDAVAPVSVADGHRYARESDARPRDDARDPDARKKKVPDAVFVPTPPDVVRRMLELAAVKKGDVVYDLGSGDGRIVIAAAKEHGCKAVGVELDQKLVTESRERAKAAGVEKFVTFERGDLFEADFSGASVVALYVLPEMSRKLVPKFEKLKPGSRIVAHCFPIPGVKPDRVLKVTSDEDDVERPIYLYTLPLTKEKPRDR